MPLLELKPLTPDLLDATLELDRRALGGLWTRDGYQRELDSPNSELLVLTSETTLIGLGCYWAILEEAHITIVAIDPAYQRQGCGQWMLWALLKSAWQRKLERATLEVRVSNHAAIALYKKFGFEIAGTRKRYYPDTGEDALILWRGDLHEPTFPQQLAVWKQAIEPRLKQAGWVFQIDDR